MIESNAPWALAFLRKISNNFEANATNLPKTRNIWVFVKWISTSRENT